MPTQAEPSTAAEYRQRIVEAHHRMNPPPTLLAIAEATLERDRLIADAVDSGLLTQAAIADDLGVSPGRVSQIVGRERTRRMTV